MCFGNLISPPFISYSVSIITPYKEPVKTLFSYELDTKFMPEISIKAQLGRMLKETPRNPGVRLAGRDIGGAILVPPSDIPTYAELGLDKKTSKLAQ